MEAEEPFTRQDKAQRPLRLHTEEGQPSIRPDKGLLHTLLVMVAAELFTHPVKELRRLLPHTEAALQAILPDKARPLTLLAMVVGRSILRDKGLRPSHRLTVEAPRSIHRVRPNKTLQLTPSRHALLSYYRLSFLSTPTRESTRYRGS